MARGNILVVSPNQLFREGLSHLLKARFKVGGEGRIFVDAIKTVAARKPVDLVILALEPGSMEAGLVQIGLLRRDLPLVKLVVLAASLSPAEFLQAIRAGVDGILTGDISSGALHASLDLVLQNQQIFLGPLGQVAAEAASSAAESAMKEECPKHNEKCGAERASNLVPFAPLRPGGGAGTPLGKARLAPTLATAAEPPHVPALSERERQVLHCLVQGSSNKTIARELEVAETTVKAHVKGVMRKVRAANRTQAAIWAMNRCAAPGEPASGDHAAINLGCRIGARPGVVVELSDQSCSA